ncbi:heavy metal translocating P-type ATPase [Frigoriglobus tundricola]|uniref:P-type Zn(2+) transporter n=1 Tax=Frigoriglobus tundricola TaxID=2774151 RepID=A0A6M5YKR8_9BACT|nr:heavy metal translocating P-type ATPase [Frigoriglobus tundricola]QJW94679.1 Cadmium-transporting ATPase [Frigoriglobus tundricola]
MTRPQDAAPPTALPGRFQIRIAVLAVACIAVHLVARYILADWLPTTTPAVWNAPLIVALGLGGLPLLWGLLRALARGAFGSDLLAGISIVTSVVLSEYLAGTLVVLMLSGGQALEAYAVRKASAVLAALAGRMPAVAHRKAGGAVADVALDGVAVGDALVVFPHEICPADGTVLEGHGSMNEAYLTGEPYEVSKTPGAAVLSGAVNGASALTVRVDHLPTDSRYAKIMRVMQDAEQKRPRLRRLGDQLGAVYTPVAVAVALAAWAVSGDPLRFLAVLVVATPCPLLIAIPVALIGAVSLAARRAIIIKDPAVLEKIGTCRVAIFDKTGTLTYGKPSLAELIVGDGFDRGDVLTLVASLERYSKHPLAGAVLDAAIAAKLKTLDASEVGEKPGQGLTGVIGGRRVRVTSRGMLPGTNPKVIAALPPEVGGMECVVLVDDRLAGTLRFRDQPRAEGEPFIRHLGRKHQFDRVLLVSGDRESEAKYLADQVGITEVFAGQTPEQKLEIVRRETAAANTVFMGDGINDAPALTAATVGIAFGQNSDVTAEAAGAVILDATLRKVDELLHISRRLRAIALQSAVGGMALSLVGMVAAAAGYLPPVAGAVFQEAIDVLAVLNALRMAFPPRSLTDY